MKTGIIGGGAAGLMAAAFCKGSEVTILGRCNVTNNCALYEFFSHILHGQKFMMSSLTAFPPQALMEYFGGLGLRLKTERGNRVFPVSDKSSDVIKALTEGALRNGARIETDTEVLSVNKIGDVFEVMTDKGLRSFDRLIVATGGVSYPSTGSTGDGYRIAESFGHTIVRPVPALCAIELQDNVRPLQGLSLRNVRATATFG